jgi:hypothetical protein
MQPLCVQRLGRSSGSRWRGSGRFLAIAAGALGSHITCFLAGRAACGGLTGTPADASRLSLQVNVQRRRRAMARFSKLRECLVSFKRTLRRVVHGLIDKGLTGIGDGGRCRR